MMKIVRFLLMIASFLLLPLLAGAATDRFGLLPVSLFICFSLTAWAVISIIHYREKAQHASWSFTRFLMWLGKGAV